MSKFTFPFYFWNMKFYLKFSVHLWHKSLSLFIWKSCKSGYCVNLQNWQVLGATVSLSSGIDVSYCFMNGSYNGSCRLSIYSSESKESFLVRVLECIYCISAGCSRSCIILSLLFIKGSWFQVGKRRIQIPVCLLPFFWAVLILVWYWTTHILFFVQVFTLWA